jgi:hypothetical protein
LHHLAAKGSLRDAVDIGKQQGWLTAARALCLAKTADLLKDELFLDVLRTNIIRDQNLEHLLTAVRCVFLREVPTQRFEDRDIVKFAIAIMHQCRANEYVWCTSDVEEACIASEVIPLENLLVGDVAAGRKFLLLSP